jgi:hypothetical protein
MERDLIMREHIEIIVTLQYDGPADLSAKQQREAIEADLNRLFDPDESTGFDERCELQNYHIAGFQAEAEIFETEG